MSMSVMEDIDEGDISEFTQSLRSMDDQSFNRFIKGSITGASTPINGKIKLLSIESIRSSMSQDPFDDGLDSVLMNIEVPKEKLDEPKSIIGDKNLIVESLPNGDLQVVGDTDDDDDDDNEEEIGSDNREDQNANSTPDTTIGKLHGFGDYATYFGNKVAKQQKADQDYVLWEKKRRKGRNDIPQIFQGCRIHVNGHTVPSINEIHRLVILHGGKFIGYLNNKSAASHIICDKLTPRKRIEFKNYRVVRAQWLVDSIGKGELLSWEDYRLIDNVEVGQQRLTLQREKQPEKERGELENAKTPQNIPLSLDPDENENENGNDNDNDNYLDIAPSIHSQQEEEEEANLTQSGELHLELINQDEPITKRGVTLDAKHPDFLKNFFAYSRLHHLSSWKADLRAHFLKKILEAPSQKKGRVNSTEKVIMHADFDCFFASASALGRKDVDINGDPLAVSHGGRTSDVASCNYVARKFGIKNGMWISEAKKLCPSLIILSYDFDLYEKLSNILYDQLIILGIFDSIFPVLIDEVLLDLSSHVESRQQEGENKPEVINNIARSLRSKIFELTGCTISVGVSKNVLLAKLCLRKAKPNGQFYLEGEVDEFLKDIPVRNLPGIGRSIVHKLTEEIERNTGSPFSLTPTILYLKQIDETRLKILFGEKTGPKLWQYLRGIDNTNIDIRENKDSLKRKSVSVDVNYGIRFDHISQVDTFLMELSKELYRRLMHLKMCGSSVALRLARRAITAPIDPPKYLGMGYCTFANKSSKLGLPTNDWGLIGSELKYLYRMLNVPVYDLRGVAVTMTNLVDIEDLKKSRQRRLPFRPPGADLEPEKKLQKRIESTIVNDKSIEPKLEPLEIDLEVFEALPSSLKAEIQDEIDRRGMEVSGTKVYSNSTTDTKPFSKVSSPQKENTSSKSYMQQLIPLSVGKVEFKRVFDSPTKTSPTKRSRPQNSPNKKAQPRKLSKSYEDSSLYDESLINELPSSVRKEVLKDLESKFKSRKKQKLQDQSKITINSDWITKQRKKLTSLSPLFQNKIIFPSELKQLLNGWIESSLTQGGPHVDDTNKILDYFEELLQQDNLLRCMNIYKHIKVVVECKNVAFNCGGDLTSEMGLLTKEGLQDWERIIEYSIKPIIERYCIQNDITIDH